jgi:hypothetical protein
MSKRKVEVGGYAMSSDDEDDPLVQPEVKKTRPDAPPILPSCLPPLRAPVPPRLSAPRTNLSTAAAFTTAPRLNPSQKGPVATVQRTALMLPTPRSTPIPPDLPNANKSRLQVTTTPSQSLSDDEGEPCAMRGALAYPVGP